MSRPSLTTAQIERGTRLTQALKDARTSADVSQTALAEQAEISVDTLRKLEANKTPSPSFFLVSAIATPLKLSLDQLARAAEDSNG